MNQERALTTTGPDAALRQVASELDKRMETVNVTLAAGITPERFRAVALSSFTRTPQLWQCEPVTVARAIVEAGQLGLVPGLLGQAYLVPYGRDCQLLIGYRGLVELARRSGEIRSVVARVVHERDEFRYQYGLHEDVVHIPALERDSGKVTHAYAVATFRDGGSQFDVMSVDEINGIRERSRAKNSGPWVTDYEEMVKKTPLRRLAKLLPLTVEVSEALDRLDPEVDQVPQVQAPATPRAVTTARQAVQARLAAREAPTTPQPSPHQEPQVAREPQSAPVVPAAPEPTPEPIVAVDDVLAQGLEELVDARVLAVEPDDTELAEYQELATNGALHGAPVVPEPVVAVCNSPSPWTEGHFCILEPGHPGNHRAGNRESWSQK